MKKRRLMFAFLTLLFLSAMGLSPLAASAEAVTLAELRRQAPARLQMTVTTDAGNTVAVDAPVILPEAVEMPILQAKYMLMDTSDLREKYPIEKGTPAYVREADAVYNFAGSPVISYYVGSENTLYGKMDTSARAVLAPGETPPENGLTLERVVDIVYNRIAEFGGDPSVDLRVYRANAMSGLYRVRMVKFEDKEAGVSHRMPEIDPDKPIQNSAKGIWDIRLTQYFHGIPVFPTCYQSSEEGVVEWPYPIMGYVRMLDESNMSMLFSCCVETGVLQNDAALAPFTEVERAIRERMRSGQLKSVYQISLGYAVRLVKGDAFFTKPDNNFNTDARFVLTPVWQVCGYDLKDREHRYYQGYTEPDERTVMQSLDGDFELWFNAETAKPVMSYEYDLEVGIK